MKVFVTGGSGYVGNAIVAALQRAGHAVTALVRSPEKIARVEMHGACAVVGSFELADSYADAARAADAIVHAGADMSRHMASRDAMAVEVLVEAAARGGRRLIYTSGSWVYGETRGRVVDEDSPLAPAEIVAWRPASEERVLASARQGVAACIVRPGAVYGGRGFIFGDLMLGRLGAVTIVGEGENRWSTVYLDDLADLFVRAVEQAPAGQIFNATDGSRPRVREIGEALAQVSGRRVVAWPVEEARQKLGLVADALAIHQEIASPRARDLLGWRPAHRAIISEAAAILRAATVVP
ncbi:MAG TPA: NAD-dependent epimerase/dehydratase family protein [Pirellulales bacterium]|nr:NAD-dependent epimerase/dehydratase family protein [Pirellulales bacterium]